MGGSPCAGMDRVSAGRIGAYMRMGLPQCMGLGLHHTFAVNPPLPPPPHHYSEALLLDAYFGIPGMVAFSRGEGGLPRVFLKHPYCESAAEIYLHGATVTQVWGRRGGGISRMRRQSRR